MPQFHLKRRAVVCALLATYWIVGLTLNSIPQTPLFASFFFNFKAVQLLIALALLFWVDLPLFAAAAGQLTNGYFTQELLLGVSVLSGFLLLLYSEFANPATILPLGLFLATGSLFSVFRLMIKKWIDTKTETAEIDDSRYFRRKVSQSHLIVVATIAFCSVVFFLASGFDYPTNLVQNALLILVGGTLVTTLTDSVLISFYLVLSRSEDKHIIWKNPDQIPTIATTKSAILRLGNVFIHPKVRVEEILAARPKEVAYLAACLEKNIDHPIASAIVNHAEKIGLKDFFASDIESFPAKGVVGKIGGRKVAVGNMALMKQEGIVVGVLQREKYRLEDKGMEVLIVGISSEEKNRLDKKPGEVLGMIVFKNEIRLSAKKIVEELKKLSVDLWVVTGHSARFSKAIAKEINIPEEQIISEKLPEEVAEAIGAIDQNNNPPGGAILVDVIVDKESSQPIIDISIIGNAHHNVMVIDDNLSLVAEAIAVSRRGMKLVEKGLLYSGLYYSVVIAVAITGLVGKQTYAPYLTSAIYVLDLLFLAFLIYYPFRVMGEKLITK